MTCKMCERPDAVCECFEDLECRVVDHPVFHWDGSRSTIPAVCIGYGSIPFDSTDGIEGCKVTSGMEYELFVDRADAEDYAEFLNSDAIFDCVIPGRFLDGSGAKQ